MNSSARAVAKGEFRSRATWPLFVLATPCLVATLAADTHYVTLHGSAAPERNDPNLPWQLVEAAANALPRFGGGVVSISPGTYREAFTLDTPTVLIAPLGGVTIGDSSGVVATTTFNVLTWNTHLFGNVIGRHWKDYPRAERFGAYFGAIKDRTDLVALCEIWDENLFRGGNGAVGIWPLSGFPNGIDFADVLPSRIGHSGLSMLCLWPLLDQERFHYLACCGVIECAASKGFMAATVTKDGFAIRVYNTHTQAEYSECEVATRRFQVQLLKTAIQSYRVQHPSHIVLVMGDFNVIGDPATPGDPTGEYAFLRDEFGALGGRDAARHAPDGAIYHDPWAADTLTSFNELAVYFDDDHKRHDRRLDYVWYFPSADGKMLLQPTEVRRRILTGPSRTEDDFTSDEWSDHYPVEAHFRLDRLQ